MARTQSGLPRARASNGSASSLARARPTKPLAPVRIVRCEGIATAPESETGIPKDARWRALLARYGQVGGWVTVTLTTEVPSVTLTVAVAVGAVLGGPPGPARVMVSVLPEATAVTRPSVEFTL